MAKIPIKKAPPIIKVWPRDEDIARVLRHPTGVRFGQDVSEGVGWPADAFTYRRIRDGDVLEQAPGEKKKSVKDKEN